METIQKVTFTPLTRNRFKCNQTGVVVKKQRTKKYTLAHYKKEQNKRKQKEKEKIQIFKGIDPPRQRRFRYSDDFPHGWYW